MSKTWFRLQETSMMMRYAWTSITTAELSILPISCSHADFIRLQGSCISLKPCVIFQGWMIHSFMKVLGTLKAAETAEKLMAHGRGGDTPVAIVSNGTLPHQSVVTGRLKNLSELAENAPRPALIVIGEVVSLREELKWFQENPAQSRLHTMHEQAA